MTELIILGVFAAVLLGSMIANISMLYALLLGYALFFGYGIYKRHTVREMLKMSLDGIKTARNVLFLFVLIGMITALWRAGGTVAYIVYYATSVCTPQAMLIVTFLLCCLISTLTGTAFGTVATVGVICMTMADSMGIPTVYTGGAILAGIFFGDRCSPVSTSALLICELTGTDIYSNIKRMVRTALVPFALSCAVYIAIGLFMDGGEDTSGMRQLFYDGFRLHWLCLAPAAAILIASAFKLNVKLTLGASIAVGALCAALIQGIAPLELLHISVHGFHPEDASLAALTEGGGILSMAKVFAIVCLSSCYAGIFGGTGFLDGIRRLVDRLGERLTPFGATLCASAVTGLVACNQTLDIMLTHQLCRDMYEDGSDMALALEDTSVVVSCLIPWCIACAVPLATVGAPSASILTAFYLYLLPLSRLISALAAKRRAARSAV